MMQPVIRFENVGKLYRLGTVGTGTLTHDIHRWWITNVMRKEDPYLQIGETNDRSTKGSSDYVYALKDITFDVQQGDVIGIIGKNGAGKSTLLKLLSRVTAPTTGKIYTKGRIASLLEVGTGFHPELTGRENIYMNGSILGMKKHEIDRKLDEIVGFSGCERYIDTPVKRYSSGMMVRLGFAVAAHLDPEILIVDEVLAVGDAEFQKKAIGKMQDVSKGEGRTVLFVSHNMASVRRLCNTGILLQNGSIKTTGLINDVIEKYIGGEVTGKNAFFEDLQLAPGNDIIRIKSFEVLALDGSKSINVETGLRFKLVFMNYQPNIMIDTTFELHTIEDIIVFHTGKVLTPEKDSKVGLYSVEFDIPPFILNSGMYKMILWFGENQKYILWGKYEHVFEVENTLKGQGYNMNTLPGILKPRFVFRNKFLG
ncbi:MAG: ATP-binding cassette domain-containing protein [Bacteroidales bacterium]|nr:ATP-binding cassette domain-containing protein [Bacteroidales bacterium]